MNWETSKYKKSQFNYGDLIQMNELPEYELFFQFAYRVQMLYKNYVIGITPKENSVFVVNKENTNYDYMNLISMELNNKAKDVSNFAVVKYFLEKWFYDISISGYLEFSYRPDYLIKSSELAKELDVSRATIMRYVGNGMETVEGYGHTRYPKHNAFYWKNGLWSSRVQALKEQIRVRNRSEEELIKELEEKIQEYEDNYNGTFEVVFKDILDGKRDIYELDEVDDYEDWRDLIEEFKEIKENKQ